MKTAVYRSSKRDELYVYVRDGEGGDDPLAVVPAELQAALGTLTLVMSVELTPERKLARAKPADVVKALESQGFYIQSPPEGFIDPSAPAPEGWRGA